MFKKVIFFSIFLSTSIAFAQKITGDLFRLDNPNLINPNEAVEYKGSPLVYIEGVKAPERATNDEERLQLKFFGTKNIQEVTKDNLKLSEGLPQNLINQDQNLTFQNPFHKTVKSGFIPHISNFIAIIQILSQTQTTIEEHISLINTDENNYWTRTMLLPQGASIKLTGFTQNGTSYTLPDEEQKRILSFKAPHPLKLGANSIVMKYTLDNPFQKGLFQLNLLETDLIWPIEQFDAVVLFSNPTQILSSKLLFGNNQMDIPDIYTQEIDQNSNLHIIINRVIPPHAKIKLQMQFDDSKLPTAEQTYTVPLILAIGSLLLIMYWILFGWLEKRHLIRGRLPKIKYPHNTLCLAHQLDTVITEQKWQLLIDFGKANNWPITKLMKEQNQQLHKPFLTHCKTIIANFWALMFEPIMGTFILLVGIGFTLYMAQNGLILGPLIGLIILSIAALTILYSLALKPIRQLYWQKKLAQLSDQNIMTGLTALQVRQIYPLFVITHKQDEWCQKLIQTNPKVAQETHLYKEKE